MIKESCSCGATFEMHDDRYANFTYTITFEQQAAIAWRADHQHQHTFPLSQSFGLTQFHALEESS